MSKRPFVPLTNEEFESVARSVGIDEKAINLRDAAEIERSVAAFARTPNGGLILTAGNVSAFS